MKKRKFAILFTLMFAFTVLVCAGTRIVLEKSDVDYQEVQVRIVSGKQTRGKSTKTELIVSYNGEENKLHGVTQIFQYQKGQNVTAYLSDGKLYEEVRDIKGESPLFIVSLVFGLVSVVLLVPMLSFWIDYNKMKKKDNQVRQ